MRRLALCLVILATVVLAAPRPAGATYCAEFYRDNLFLGLAYHRIACLTDWYTIQDNAEWDGFTTANYCNAGTSSDSVPSGEWFDGSCFASSVSFATAKYSMNYYGTDSNTCYATPNYQERSNVCSYDILADCNSDCWMEDFSTRLRGTPVSTASPCWGSPPVSSVHGLSCDH